MEKSNIYSRGRKMIGVYLIFIIMLGIFIISQLNQQLRKKDLNYIYQNTLTKIGIESFIKSAFSLSPNLKYLCTKDNSSKIENVDKVLMMTNSFFPILGYMVNNEIVTDYAISEIYPFLSPKQKENNELEVFSQSDKLLVNDGKISNDNVQAITYTYEQLTNFDFMLGQLYTVDSGPTGTKVSVSDFDIDYFLNTDMRLDFKDEGPKILIYHTHSQEAFVDSRPGEESDTVVGLGEELARILEEEYGIEVLHHKGVYDMVDGVLNRDYAYSLIEEPLKKILAENPSIELIIDLHRDGFNDPNLKFVTEINGKPAAKIMFFNGMCRLQSNGEAVPLTSFPNPFIKDNMALSFQMQLKASELYPGFTRKIYLKGYRYNMHLMPKTLLIEAGSNNNTLEEMMNSMEALAEIISEVIK